MNKKLSNRELEVLIRAEWLKASANYVDDVPVELADKINRLPDEVIEVIDQNHKDDEKQKDNG